jgi:hypothetical protein
MDERDRHVLGTIAAAYDLKPAQAARMVMRAGMMQLGFLRGDDIRPRTAIRYTSHD